MTDDRCGHMIIRLSCVKKMRSRCSGDGLAAAVSAVTCSSIVGDSGSGDDESNETDVDRAYQYVLQDNMVFN